MRGSMKLLWARFELVALAEKNRVVLETPWNDEPRLSLVLKGKAFDAIQVMNSGIAAWRSTASTVWLPWHLTYLGIAYAQLRRFDDAWRCIGEAVTAIEITKEIIQKPKSIALLAQSR